MSNPVSAISGGISAFGAIKGASAAKSAANAQQKAADASIAAQQANFNTTRNDTAPYRNSGVASNNMLDTYLGIGNGNGTNATAGFTPLSYDQWAQQNPGTPQQSNFDSRYVRDYGFGASRTPQTSNAPTQAGYSSYLASHPSVAAHAATNNTDPNFGSLLKPFSQSNLDNDVVYNTGLKFGMDQGIQGINRAENAHGGFDSGATLKALAEYGNNYGNQRAGDAYSRFMGNKENTYNMLSGQAGRGIQATGLQAGVGTSTANNISSALYGAGNAQAAGTIGAANAWSTGLSGIAGQFGSRPSNSTVFIPPDQGGGAPRVSGPGISLSGQRPWG